MSFARSSVALAAATALALVCVAGCGAYAPAEWPDAGPSAADGVGEEREEPDGA